MQYTDLGQTGLKVSRLCFGALTIGPLQRDLPPKEGAEVIQRALDLGVNFIDTAELYGTYPHIAEAIRGRREEVIIASKSYAVTKKEMEKSLKEALAALGTDYLDIFLLHEQESAHTIRGHWGAFECLLEAKEKGIVRAVGISTHAVAATIAAASIPEIDIIHPLYNIRGLGILDGTREEMRGAIERAGQFGKGIYAMKPLGGGNFRSDVKGSLEYILETPGVDAVAIGMKSPQEVELNVKLVSGEEVEPELAQEVAKHPRKLLINNWCCGCGHCVERCSQGALSIVDGQAKVEHQKCILCGYCASACRDFAIKVI